VRIVCFGRATRDETLYLENHISVGGNTKIRFVETVVGGMVSWAGAAVRDFGHTPVLVGSTGVDTPHEYLGNNVEDYLLRDGLTNHLRVLVDPSGQRSFLSQESAPYPPIKILPQYVSNIGGVLVDGYAILPERNVAEAVELVAFVRTGGDPRIPVVVTLPVVDVLKIGDRVSLLCQTFNRLGNVVVVGGIDEHAALTEKWLDRIFWTTVVTTGSNIPYVDVKLGRTLVHREPVNLVTNPCNTNGAGDVFAAGVIVGMVEQQSLASTLQKSHETAKTHILRTFSEEEENGSAL